MKQSSDTTRIDALLRKEIGAMQSALLSIRKSLVGRVESAEPRKTNPWVVTTASISAAAAVVGIIFGVRALTLRPGKEAITGSETSVDDLRADQERAEDAARVADISFAVSLVSGASAAVLWVRDSAACPEPKVARVPFGVTVKGSF